MRHRPAVLVVLGQARLRFRDAMASLSAAVNVVTTAGEAGRCGITATAAITDGGVSVTEHTAVAVIPQRPASPAVVTTFTAGRRR
jgi:flavin reductase (DIM6/NTAB) family NADH-FMN oxidoreductase RutF